MQVEPRQRTERRVDVVGVAALDDDAGDHEAGRGGRDVDVGAVIGEPAGQGRLGARQAHGGAGVALLVDVDVPGDGGRSVVTGPGWVLVRLSGRAGGE